MCVCEKINGKGINQKTDNKFNFVVLVYPLFHLLFHILSDFSNHFSKMYIYKVEVYEL